MIDHRNFEATGDLRDNFAKAVQKGHYVGERENLDGLKHQKYCAKLQGVPELLKMTPLQSLKWRWGVKMS